MPSAFKPLLLLSAFSAFSFAKLVPATQYVIDDLYTGETFFDGWDFILYSPTNGFVQV